MNAKKETAGCSADTLSVWDLAHARIRAHFNIVQTELPYHIHPHFELLYIVKGTRLVEIEEQHFKVRPGNLLIFRPDETHREYPGTKCISYFVFRFRAEELTEAGIEFPARRSVVPVVSLARQEELCTLFSRMLEEQGQADEGSQLLLGAYLVEFVVTLRRAIRESWHEVAGAEEMTLHSRIHSAIRLMERSFVDHCDIRDVARSVFMSPSHFSQAFRQNVKESPKRFLINKRIAKAKELVRTTNLSGKEIAAKLGYASPYYFYRQFRMVAGVTVTDYRARNRQESASE